MWVILKYKKKELSFLKQDLKMALGDLPFCFRPKIKCQKLIRNKLHFIENDLLGDYLICHHDKFRNKNLIKILKNLRGLKYFLKDSQENQKDITSFVNYCKQNQGEDGYIKQSFFNFSNLKKGMFLSGPFTNMIFNIIENQGNRLKVLIGNVKTTISKNTDYLYRSV